jgi:predicted Na+-dependent transporter
MNSLKRLAGFIWIALGAIVIYLLFSQAGIEITEANAGKRPLLDTQMFWYIIIPIFLPIIVGLLLFGWYAWKGEYDVIARDSEHLT